MAAKEHSSVINTHSVTINNNDNNYSVQGTNSETAKKDFLARYQEAFKLEEQHESMMKRVRRQNDKDLAREKKKEQEDILKELYEKELEGVKKVSNVLSSITSSITSKLDSTINSYIDKQEAINAHLIGTNANFAGVSDTLNSVLGSTSIVKQANVYENLSKLVNAGIVYNVEQRAFLETLSDDLGMIFSATDGTLTRMIRLLGDDISANQMALEYSLQEFLNQNYKTSEYIQSAFTDVANQLVESQSLMTSSQALAYSGTIQSWMGSLYSAGASSSTVSSLAKALDQLSSGDTSGLGQGISNLVLMGVARAGLDYGSLLENNLTDSDVDTIMVNIAEYLQEMGGNSNVVMSQLAKLFGVSVSDIVASTNLRSTTGNVSSNVSELGGVDELLSNGQLLKNRYENAMYTWGTNIASNDFAYTSYLIEGAIADVGNVLYELGGLMSTSKSAIISATGTALGTIGIAGKNAQLLTLIPTLIQTIASGELGIGSGFLGNTDMMSLFNALGSSSILGSTVKISGTGVSGGMYVSGAGSTGDMFNGLTSSMNDTIDTLGVNGDKTEETDHIANIDENVYAIRDAIETLNTIARNFEDFGIKVIQSA